MDAGLFSGDADRFEPLLTAEGPVLADQYTTLIAPADDQVLYLKDHQITQAQRTGGPGTLRTSSCAWVDLVASFGGVRVANERLSVSGLYWKTIWREGWLPGVWLS